jgi:hypothetical protein
MRAPGERHELLEELIVDASCTAAEPAIQVCPVAAKMPEIAFHRVVEIGVGKEMLATAAELHRHASLRAAAS